jgi:hypothetical protein
MCEEAKIAPYYKDVRRSVLVWSDILGFSNMINDADANSLKSMATKLDAAITAAQKHFEDKAGAEWGIAPAWATKSFTDNVIIGYPIVNPNGFELFHSIYMTAHYQIEMVLSDFFVRGAIAINDTYLDKNVVISKALIEAYDDETKKAKVPRIMLSQSVKSFVDSQLEQFRREGSNPPLINALEEGLLIDCDGQYFINYLEIVSKNSKGSFDINKHKIIIETKLIKHSHEPEIYRKYQWCAEYHNYFCSQHPDIPELHKVDINFRDKPLFQKLNQACFTDFIPN